MSHLAPEEGAAPACIGSTSPFANLHDMSGSVEEFTDECILWPCHCPSDIAELNCLIRGGGFSSIASELTCGSYASFSTIQAEPTVGFRCCKDLPWSGRYLGSTAARLRLPALTPLDMIAHPPRRRIAQPRP